MIVKKDPYICVPHEHNQVFSKCPSHEHFGDNKCSV